MIRKFFLKNIFALVLLAVCVALAMWMTVRDVQVAQMMPYDQLREFLSHTHDYSQSSLRLAKLATEKGWHCAVVLWFLLYFGWALLLIFMPFFIAERWVKVLLYRALSKRLLWVWAAILALMLIVVFYVPWLILYAYFAIWIVDAVYIVFVLVSKAEKRLKECMSD